ncbi:tRNA (N6-isopentenyl adenosine(37)-C2)-methylthiotransferase MiaB [Adhaeribacter arboris]|uniref:tRNA-2-methylthio-N(6)-dimethylallyladenosine synthase n=1 Tax=Adhaeribacter arboris TaxID=2072846 RepID=A0A2T2YCD6_9BACT|nr:tRNA (N6-isopentenyl adenosine(37)-C2)-methylthiotransferase MiaB [Adhaeribacter arboris]PSR53163.1 tRNA (N6-isopentenyl adenosine(37)-C2)-methylthiotransferase MiaB [Adhaeribacter arboris]
MNNLVVDLDFIDNRTAEQAACETKISAETNTGNSRKLYIESYGCQMNFSDSEIVTSILFKEGFDTTADINKADVVFLNTCSIREKAEQTVRHRLVHLNGLRKRRPGLIIGVLGCMAERLKKNFLEEEKIVDLVVGPDAYRDLPNLINEVDNGHKAVNVLLSREETYADINPIRLNSNGVSAFVSIMRGCNNMCSFCVVPFTRGRERSRDSFSIIREVEELVANGFKEVTLLGQNVDSYRYTSEDSSVDINFAGLLARVAQVSSDLRVRFSTSHPKDITDEVLYTIKKYDNICNYIHLPVQSGNSRILELMNRTYDRDWYLNRVDAIRRILGEDCGISSDMITGFCSETEAEHEDTLSLMDYVQYDYSYMFYYSERPGTLAARKLQDDVPLEVKKRRLAEVIEKQRQLSLQRNQLALNQIHRVLVEGFSKKSTEYLSGRNDQNKVVVFPKKNYQKGDYVNVQITDCSVGTLIGEAIN